MESRPPFVFRASQPWSRVLKLMHQLEFFAWSLNSFYSGSDKSEAVSVKEDPLAGKKKAEGAPKPDQGTTPPSTAESNDTSVRGTTERLFRNPSVYKGDIKEEQHSFTTTDMQILLDGLFFDLAKESLETEMTNRSDKDKKKAKLQCSLNAEGHAFEFLEWCSGSTLNYLEAWLKTINVDWPSSQSSQTEDSESGSSSATACSSSYFEFKSKNLHAQPELLIVPVLDDTPYSSDLPRVQLREDLLYQEAAELAPWSIEKHTLTAALEKVQFLLAKRYEVLRKMVVTAVDEATAFIFLCPKILRKDGSAEAGSAIIDLLNRKALITLDYSEEWAKLHLQLDAIPQINSDYRSKLGAAAVLKAEWRQKCVQVDLQLARALRDIYGPYTTLLDKIGSIQRGVQKGQSSLETELADHRQSILCLSAKSLNALDVLVAIAEQFVDKDFVVDPKHFVNYVHGLLGKGEIGFSSFHHASKVRSIISAHAAAELKMDINTPWPEIVVERVKICRQVAESSKAHLQKQMIYDWPSDDKLAEHANAVVQHAYDRAIAVLDFKEKSVHLTTAEQRLALGALHVRSTALIMERDHAIQSFHKRRDYLDFGHMM